MSTIQFAFDKQTSRSRDADGRMRVKNCILSTAEVNPYNGREIPGWDKLGLDPDKVYHLHRTPEALADSVPTWEGVPLMLKHTPSTANDPKKEYKAGAVHSIKFDGKHLRGDLLVDDGHAIDLIESEQLSDLSGGYRYVPTMRTGVTKDGKAHDGTMDAIQGNHVALVDDGRATGAHVADAAHKPVTHAEDATVPNPVAAKVQKKEQNVDPNLNPQKGAAPAPAPAPGGNETTAAAPAAAPAPAEPATEQNEESRLAMVGEALKHIAKLLEAIHDQPPGGDTTMSKANDARHAADAEREAEDRRHAHDEELRGRYSEDKRRKAYDKEHEGLAEDEREAEDKKHAHDEEMAKREAEDKRREAYDAAFPDEGEQDGTGARGEDTPHGAMDAKSVSALVSAAVAAERKRADAVETAKRDVRDVLGDVYGMDSAGDIYRAALEQVGVDPADVPKGTEKIAFQAFKAARSNGARPAGYAMDSSAAQTEVAANQKSVLAHLSRISVKG